MLAVCAPAPVHAYPALRPERALLVRIPLGPRPSLHRLRGGLLRFVRRLPSYYGEVRLLASVHHRLRLLTFPMRAGNGGAVPVRPEISQLPMRSLCRTCCLRANENSRPLQCLIFRGSIPHPMQSLCTLRVHCRQWPRNTHYQAGATPYLGRTFTGWIAPACGWRTPSITSSARASSCGGTSRPSALAVLRLITSSYLVGACTGRSAGFSPLRMQSTYWAAERNWLTRSDPYDIRPPTSMK